MSLRDELVIDGPDLSNERRVEVCRFALQLVSQDAATFETDIPIGNAADWPAPVNRAAQRLMRHATGRRGKKKEYKRTGVVSARDPEDWDALVCFAPYAFDATVWAADGELASLADEGTSLVLHLSPDQHAQLEAFESSVRRVPVKEWKKSRSPRRPQRN